jgi:hypothetical protein
MALSVHDREILRRRVAGLVDAALLEEHRRRPFGPHSSSLAEVLDFLRRNPDPGRPRYVVLDTGRGFATGVRAGRPGDPPRQLDGELHDTRGEAEHAVLRRRLGDYGLLP